MNWIGESTDGERLAEFAGRLCYMSQHNPASRTTRDYLENIKKQGHGSVLEHANYSLLLEGVSRSLTHELVRHRAGFAYSQLSQRYVDESEACFVVPPAIIGDEALESAWRAQIEARAERVRRARRAADGALRLGRRQGPPPEDGARGGARRAPELHRDEDRRHRERARLAHDARAALERGRRAGDSPHARSRCSACCSRRRRASSRTSRSTWRTTGARRRASRITRCERLERVRPTDRRADFFRRRISHCAKNHVCLSSPHFSSGVRLARVRVRESDAAPAPAGFHSRDGMTRIGFAYNQKPEPEAAACGRGAARADEEPPSSGTGKRRRSRRPLRRSGTRRRVRRVGLGRDDRRRRARPRAARRGDSPRGRRRFPRAAPRRAPRHRLQHRRRAARPEPRGARPGDLRVLRHPVLRQRSVHPRALPRQGAHQGDPPCQRRRRPRDWALVRDAGRPRARRRARLAATRCSRSRCTRARPRESPSETSSPTHDDAARRSSLELLERYEQPVLVEEFLPGAEFTCGVLGNGDEARVLPIVGMNFDVAPRRRAADLRLRGQVALGSPGEPSRDLRVPGADLRRRCAREIEDVVAARLPRARLPRLVARSTSGSMPTGSAERRRGESASRHSPQPRGQLLPSQGGARRGADYDALIGACLAGRRRATAACTLGSAA